MALPANLSGHRLHNFIGGRRHVNAIRKQRALNRRWRLIHAWRRDPSLSKADMARRFGVHRSTITRDIQALKRDWQRSHTCPLCGHRKLGRNPIEDMEWTSEVQRSMPHLFP